MEVKTKYRKKPKKADFVHNNVAYWISSAHYYLFWDGEYDQQVYYTCSYYDSDEELDDEEMCEDDEYLKKSQKAGKRVMPFDHSAYEGYLY